MVTLKKHYATATAVQITGLLIIGVASIQYKKDRYVFTPKGQDIIRTAGLATTALGVVMHYAAHGRVILRVGKYISKKVGGSK